MRGMEMHGAHVEPSAMTPCVAFKVLAS
jgi:hypothetical protein